MRQGGQGDGWGGCRRRMRIGGVVRWLRVLFPYLPAGVALPRAGRARVEACIWVRVWCVAFGGAAQRVGRQSLPPQKEKWGEAALSSLPPSPPPLSLSHLPQAHWSRAPFPRKTKAPRSLPEPGWEGRNTPKRQAGEEGAGAAREGGPPTLQARPPAQKKPLRAWRCVARHAAESGAGAGSITFFYDRTHSRCMARRGRWCACLIVESGRHTHAVRTRLAST